MRMKVHQQASFVILNRAYSETSWVVEVITRDYGRLALLAKGARRIKSKLKGVLLPFQPLLLSWTGKGELPTLTSAEIDQRDFNLIDNELTGDALVCGFYCNELMANFCHRHDPHIALFDCYQQTILRLSRRSDLSAVLRHFEQLIIREAGYAVSFEYQGDGKTPIVAERFYNFVGSHGFVSALPNSANAIAGATILSMLEPNAKLLSADTISQGKHLMRVILNHTLGNKKIISRELFYPKTHSLNTLENHDTTSHH